MSGRREVTLLVVALQFLTRLPTPTLRDFEPEWVARSARYFPLVGQVVGGVAAVAWLTASHVWSPPVAAILAVAAALLVTGALHEDGLADTADGLFGGATPARRLEIMKDSRIGAYGVLALTVTLALRTALLAGLSIATGAWVLVAGHGLARAATVGAMCLTPYAPEGRATRWAPAAGGLSGATILVAVLLAAWPLAFLPPLVSLGGVAGAILAATAVMASAKRKIGGHTGDVLGAVEQMAEVGFLLGASAALACA